MVRILDLGCGVGDSWRKAGQSAEDWELVGVDIAPDRLEVAREKYGTRGWRYVCGRGENIPLSTGSMDGALCWVSLPYMNIPQVLAEIHRVFCTLPEVFSPSGAKRRAVRRNQACELPCGARDSPRLRSGVRRESFSWKPSGMKRSNFDQKRPFGRLRDTAIPF